MGNFCSRLESEIYGEEELQSPSPTHRRGTAYYEMLRVDKDITAKPEEYENDDAVDASNSAKIKYTHYEGNKMQKVLSIQKI